MNGLGTTYMKILLSFGSGVRFHYNTHKGTILFENIDTAVHTYMYDITFFYFFYGVHVAGVACCDKTDMIVRSCDTATDDLAGLFGCLYCLNYLIRRGVTTVMRFCRNHKNSLSAWIRLRATTLHSTACYIASHSFMCVLIFTAVVFGVRLVRCDNSMSLYPFLWTHQQFPQPFSDAGCSHGNRFTSGTVACLNFR